MPTIEFSTHREAPDTEPRPGPFVSWSPAPSLIHFSLSLHTFAGKRGILPQEVETGEEMGAGKVQTEFTVLQPPQP